ncbi:MAG: hypothetical protein K2O69_04770 [Odoribacter sp.]|nr:hypothetical protein [Odoribacter sp.]
MKIKCFLVWAFLVFLLFSCSYELEGPPPFDATALDNFGVADARYYFEENASDLSYVRFSEHQHHPSTRSEEEGYPELSPDWSRAVRTENTEAVLVEVPIRAEQVMLSVVRHFEDGKFRLSRVCESRVRLMIARRSNGRTQMFVTTLVPSAKYPPREQDIENFRYLGGGNFTGKVFCSTLDGHFVEASQYVNGRFVGMLDVTTRKQLSERGESLQGTSYESIMLSSAVKTKSGTYFFSEGGSSYTTCPYHPQYIAGSCPYCLDEVIVRNCQYCGARLENGQTCNCRNCSRCGYYPCRCCRYCLNYPCTCVSKCEICRPYSCTKCNECGRHYCFGACKQTGNEEKLPGGDTGSGDDTKTPISPVEGLSKAIFSDDSKLTEAQWNKVELALENINQDCLGGKLIGEVIKQGIKLIYCDTLKANGSYSHKQKELKIKKFYESDLTERLFERTLLHELIHSRQSGDVNSAINQEIEVRVADRHYAQKYKINYSSKHKAYVESILSQLNVRYIIQNNELYNEAYNNYVEFLQTDVDYKKYKESSSARNLSTIQRLAEDCQ